ncbi:hypothetical protein Pmani_016483 [Petrolisthes manimaculis]|uniref:ATP-dependent DNA helicase n=1 Tax=Petrolisthes manimaculis TaxID=1843537 RepID=A0AAE1PPL1_9EUCA|nr:hypothetical protein Pmani_016483 [Petrolisthes manimaculis]
MRLLLHHVRGPTSFEDLRTHEGHVCGTYREACLLYGLLEDDEHWNLTLEDAAATKHPKQMRQLFAIMLQTCEMSNPAVLWDNHKEGLSEDIHYRVQCEKPDMEVLYNNDILNEALLNEGAALSTEMTRETNYNSEELAAFVAANQPKMVHDQATAFNIIMASIEEEHGGLFFLDAPGGTVVLSGDFRQTLPVITRGTRADEVNACIKTSQLWQRTKRLILSTNIRVQLHGGESAGQFANQLLQVGNGQILPSSDDQIKLPFGQMIGTENDLIMKVFPNFTQHFTSTAWLCERTILAPKNEAVNNINHKLLDAQPGRSMKYKSVDTVPDDDQVVNYPAEFLNSLDPPGMPPHNL